MSGIIKQFNKGKIPWGISSFGKISCEVDWHQFFFVRKYNTNDL